MVPQLHQENKIINTDKGLEFCIDINRCFNWINEEFTTRISSSSKEFLAYENFDFYLLAVSDKPHFIWKGNDFFVTQIKVYEDCFLYIRISNIAAQVILDSAFGKRKEQKGDLNLKNITELEARILTAYNEFLYKNIEEIFPDQRKIKKLQKEGFSGEDLIYLTFYIHSDCCEEAGKILFSFPKYLLKKAQLIEVPEIPIEQNQLEVSRTEIDIYVGKSKISLEDLKNLESDDIVILEKSNLHSMVIKGEEEIQFNVNPDPRLVIDINDMEGGQAVNGESSSTTNIWDSLQVEVTAEFEKIKVSLGELRQMTEGLVVDLAPIVHNKMFLQVEGKKLASGELVIVGDKYGIRIDKIFEETKEEQEIATQEAAMNLEENQQKALPNEADEDLDDTDFDYSDFEIEDDI